MTSAMRLRQVLLTAAMACTLVIACGDDDDDGGPTKPGSAGEAGAGGDDPGGGGKGGRGGTPGQGGGPNPNLGGEGGVAGLPGTGGSGGAPEACADFVEFVRTQIDATADDSVPTNIPDFCPTGEGADLDAPASAFDDLF